MVDIVVFSHVGEMTSQKQNSHVYFRQKCYRYYKESDMEIRKKMGQDID